MNLSTDINKIFVSKIIINKVRHLQNVEIPIANDTKKHLIITGKNGSGKTSLLEAIAIYIQMIFYNNFNVEQNKERIKSWQYATANLKQDLKKNEDGLQRIAISQQITQMSSNIDSTQSQLNKSSAVTLEVSNGFLINEAVKNGNFLIDFEQFTRINEQQQVVGTKSLKFKDSYLPKDNLSEVFSQFLTNQRNDMLNYKEENDNSNYDNIKKWLTEIVNLFRDIYEDDGLDLKYNMQKRVYEIVQKDREPFGLNEMSSGYAAYLKIVSEVLLRMNIVAHGNYNLNGICIIDEIDAHLHVDLQSKAMPLLTKFFPNIQFIITTHSPFVITSISNAVVYDLENKILIDDPSRYSVDAIYKTYFHVNNYSNELKEKLKRYDNLSSQNQNGDSEKKELEDLMEYFNNVPTHFSPELKSRILDIQLKVLLNDKH